MGESTDTYKVLVRKPEERGSLKTYNYTSGKY
jgi:hypothetical protein